MPVVTRSQTKPIVSDPAPKSLHNPALSTKTELRNHYTCSESNFMKRIDALLNIIAEKRDMSSKIWNTISMFNDINRHLGKFLQNDRAKWTGFAAAIYNKTTQFEGELDTYKEVDPDLVDKLRTSYLTTRKFLTTYFKTYRFLFSTNELTSGPYAELYKNIELCELNTQQNQRPRRNVPVVNYAGMDTIEPENEDDGITDIWRDETIEYDPDYNPEEDEDEEDDDEEWCEEN